MQNFVPLGTGNSRLMKSNIPAGTTWEQAIAMLNSGTFPYDTGQLNAAGISVEGTPLNKQTLLQDSTAQQFGLTGDATVDQVLSLLSRFQTGLGNEYLWEKSKTGWSGSASGNLTLDDGDPGTYNCSNSYSISENGEISLSGNIEEHRWKDIPNGWYTDYYNLDNELYQLNSQTGSTIRTYKTITPVLGKIDISYVNSTNPSAYPPPVPDGYTYTPLGQLGNKVQIATGSYAGTGTYGEDNPNSFTFDGKPVFVIIGLVIPNNQYGHASFGLFSTTFLTSEYGNAGYAYFRNDSLMTIGYAKLDGNTLYWYSENGSNAQLNSSYNYYVFALVV